MTHHMVWDGWSFDIMWDELAAIYPAFSKGQPCPLMPMTIQYGDFARWQQERLKRKDMEKTTRILAQTAQRRFAGAKNAAR